jgi:hypothetical protein
VGSAATSFLCLISAVIAGFCGGRAGSRADSSAAQQTTQTLDEVRVRRLVIVDADDQVRGSFEVGQGSASTRVTLWMGGPGGNAPSVTLSIDQLEGTPEARLMLISEDATTHSAGRLLLRSTFGLPSVGLSHGDGADREVLVLGSETLESASALSYEAGGTKSSWPR